MKKIFLVFLLLSFPLLGDDTSGDSGGSSPNYSSKLDNIIEAIVNLPNALYITHLLDNALNVSLTLTSLDQFLRSDLGTAVTLTYQFLTSDLNNNLTSIRDSLSWLPEFKVNMENFKNQNHIDLESILTELSDFRNDYNIWSNENGNIFQRFEDWLSDINLQIGIVSENTGQFNGTIDEILEYLRSTLGLILDLQQEISTTLTEGDTNVDADLDEFSSKLDRVIDDWTTRWQIMEPFYNHFYQKPNVVSIWHAPKFSDLKVANDVKDTNLSVASDASEPSQPRGFFEILYEYLGTTSRSNADQTKALMYISKFMGQENKSEDFEDELESQTQEIQNKQSELEQSVSLSPYLENFSFEKYHELYNWGEILEPLRGYVNNENLITLGYFEIPGWEAGIDWKIDIAGLSSFTDFTRNLFKVVYYFLYALLIWWISGKIIPLLQRLFDKFIEVTYA